MAGSPRCSDAMVRWSRASSPSTVRREPAWRDRCDVVRPIHKNAGETTAPVPGGGILWYYLGLKVNRTSSLTWSKGDQLMRCARMSGERGQMLIVTVLTMSAMLGI